MEYHATSPSGPSGEIRDAVKRLCQACAATHWRMLMSPTDYIFAHHVIHQCSSTRSQSLRVPRLPTFPVNPAPYAPTFPAPPHPTPPPKKGNVHARPLSPRLHRYRHDMSRPILDRQQRLGLGWGTQA